MKIESQRTDEAGFEDRYPHRASQWRLRRTTLHFGLQPRVMGIVNVTPDSFSDGGKFFEHSRAVDHALRLAEQGADLLDVGGESTRPYATPVSANEECALKERICIL